MLALKEAQSAMTRSLELGPSELPAGLFAGAQSRVLMGMKVHANTISHARMVALEDSFPRTRAQLGHETFNEHSRRFTGLPGVTACTLARIGAGFPDFLNQIDEACVAVDLARFEWLWLEAYHAAESLPLSLVILAGYEETELPDLIIAAHPAARIVRADRAVHELIGKEVPGLAVADAILITRPVAEVLVAPARMAMATVLAMLEIPTTIGNLFAGLTEPGCKDRLSPDDFMPALIALIEMGALLQIDRHADENWQTTGGMNDQAS